MRGAHSQLTVKEEQFARLVAEKGHSLVGAYRLVYPPRNGERSATAEYVAARRVAHRSRVELRIGELREEIAASDPVEMRRRALAVLSKIMVKQLDPRYRRTATDVLRYLDGQNRTTKATKWAEYRAAAAQIAALNVIGGGLEKQGRSKPDRSPTHSVPQELNAMEERQIGQNNPLVEESPEDAKRQLAELKTFVKDRQRARFGEPETQKVREVNSQFEDLTQATEEDRTAEESQVQLTRRPGYFGKGGWTRQPKS